MFSSRSSVVLGLTFRSLILFGLMFVATHSSSLAWEIPWTEEPGGLQSMGFQRVRHDLATKQQKFISIGVINKG